MPHTVLDTLVVDLAALPGSERLFNPYGPQDRPGAAIRRANLTRYLSDMQRRSPRVLMLFEAPGYRGCALSGLPVTSERIMLEGIEKWGLFGEGYRKTSDNPQGVAEMTATILWRALVEHAGQPPLIWNTVPLHPHKPGERQSNRTPTVAEQRMGGEFVGRVLEVFDVELVLGVGRKAQRTLGELAVDHLPLRHPSQGGKAAFVEGLVAALASLER
ncbi:MAG: uracil-DNA glycosylase [Chloroflexota bacterium]